MRKHEHCICMYFYIIDAWTLHLLGLPNPARVLSYNRARAGKTKIQTSTKIPYRCYVCPSMRWMRSHHSFFSQELNSLVSKAFFFFLKAIYSFWTFKHPDRASIRHYPKWDHGCDWNGRMTAAVVVRQSRLSVIAPDRSHKLLEQIFSNLCAPRKRLLRLMRQW